MEKCCGSFWLRQINCGSGQVSFEKNLIKRWGFGIIKETNEEVKRLIYTVTLNPERDRTVVISDFAAGKVNRIQSFRDDPGGKGINVSKVIKSLGGKSVAMGILGGSTGEYIKTCLDDMGIENDFVFVDAETRTNIKVFDNVNHVTTDINEAGSPVDDKTLEKVLSRILEKAQKGDIVVFAGKIPAGAPSDLLFGWIKTLKENGILSVLDADSKTLKEGVKAAPMLIKPNETELGELLNEKLDSIEKIHAGARIVMEKNGMVFEGIERDAIYVKGAYQDVGKCAILRSEYFASHENHPYFWKEVSVRSPFSFFS